VNFAVGSPRAFDTFPLSRAELAAGMNYWLADHGNTRIGTIVESNGARLWVTMRDNVPFGLIAMRRPKLQLNTALLTPTPVSLAHGGSPIASAGLLATDPTARVGVTTARNAKLKTNRENIRHQDAPEIKIIHSFVLDHTSSYMKRWFLLQPC
jgi:hypothetical protein